MVIKRVSALTANNSRTITITAPRSVGLLFVQGALGVAFIISGTVFLLFSIFVYLNGLPQGAGVPIMMGLFCIAVGGAVILFTNGRIPKVVIDRASGKFEKLVSGKIPEKYLFDRTTTVVFSRYIYYLAGFEFKLTLEKADGSSQIVFEEANSGNSHWRKFAQFLAGATGTKFREEVWREDYEGKLSLEPLAEVKAAGRRGMQRILVPLLVSCIAAAAFMAKRSMPNFFYFGFASVLLNLTVSFWYAFTHRDANDGEWASNDFLLIVGILSLAIPYATFYALLVFAFSGFLLPS